MGHFSVSTYNNGSAARHLAEHVLVYVPRGMQFTSLSFVPSPLQEIKDANTAIRHKTDGITDVLYCQMTPAGIPSLHKMRIHLFVQQPFVGGNNLDGLAVPGDGFALEICNDIQIVAASCFCTGQQAVDLSCARLL